MESNARDFDWRTIAALNAVSTLSQIGQFGIAFVVLPVWLADQGLDATQLGMFAASLWLGQLPGLGVAPWLCKHLGPRWVIVAGLLCTVAAMPAIAVAGWPGLLMGGVVCGFGLGLRWIGVEPWLYHIAPADARGRLVGFHETLIAFAPIVAPVLASFFGLRGSAVFWMGAAFTLTALVPLVFARDPVNSLRFQPVEQTGDGAPSIRQDTVLRQGLVIALLGGMMEAALSGLFALFAQGRGLEVTQITELLALFGLGGLLMQYAVGWLADHRGVGFAAVTCAVGIVVVTLALLLPLGYAGIAVAVFFLGGCITALLTLALIASTLATSGNIARNVSITSMLYTASAAAGPLLAGWAMQWTRSDALMWFLALAAAVMAAVLGWPRGLTRSPT